MLLTPKQEEFRSRLREFAQHEIAPMAEHYDRTAEFPDENVRKLAERNLMGMIIPQKYGGLGVDNVSYSMAIEEISNACSSTGVILAVHTSVGTYPIFQYGSEQQRQRYLPILTSGGLAAFALTEPEAGSDPKAVRTKATKDKDGYLINGSKTFITNGERAKTVIVIARTDPIVGKESFTAFILEKGMKGFTYGKTEDKMGVKASQTLELFFDNVLVPEENILGGIGDGMKIALASLDGGRIGIAAQAVGIAQGAMEEAIKHAKSRVQFGKPIAQLQAIQFKLADMSVKIDAARCLVLRAAALRDAKQPFSKEASQAKLFASTMANEVVRESLQIHGGKGYMHGSKVERLYRDVKITEIYEGTSEIQRLVIARSLLQ